MRVVGLETGGWVGSGKTGGGWGAGGLAGLWEDGGCGAGWSWKGGANVKKKGHLQGN